MLQIAVCDDNKAILGQMKEILEGYKEKECVVKLYESGEALLNAQGRFHILFLDIDMKGIDGIETARQIRRRDRQVKIIYLTSYREYVSQAFSVHAFGYLLKPVRRQEIYRQIREATEFFSQEDESPVIRLATSQGQVRMAVKDLVYFEYIDRKIHMHTVQGKYVLNEKLKELAQRLEEYGFYMPHKKAFIVNLYHIKIIKGYDIIMMDETRIPLSQKKSAMFRGTVKPLSDWMFVGGGK